MFVTRYLTSPDRSLMLNTQRLHSVVFSTIMLAVVPLPLLGQGTDNVAAGSQKAPEFTNRLARESSPYLLQHAHNPVDWYPWGDEAFEKAKREQKMIFLSVGYSACHWCHVMESESFADPEIARIMNERFVCIKVDREERPDVDKIYMTAVQLVSGHGGWPMSVFLLPDARPFWGGTYFPARDGDRGRATGFLTVMNQVQDAWTNKQPAVMKQVNDLTTILRTTQNPDLGGESDEFDRMLIESVASSLLDEYDPVFGGFGFSDASANAPKFPEPSNLLFLLDRIKRPSVDVAQQDSAKRMLIKTLDGMLSGAMWDHIGGGFHRYSVDRQWQIPHFEKMLYDNGQLASVYSAAFELTKNEEYRQVAEGICDFVLRELKAPGGAFFSALDADSEGEEGKYYRWSKQDLEELKSIDSFELVAKVFRFDQEPNFEKQFYVPDPRMSLTAAGAEQDLVLADLNAKLKPLRDQMLQRRNERQRPLTDTKILTAWNGLMIAGLADTGRTLGRADYLAAAVQAANFVLMNLRDADGRLLRSFVDHRPKLNAYLDDYAFLVAGLISLHRATNDQRWLTAATQFTNKQLELFWDEAQGGFFFTSHDHSELIVRVKDPIDTAAPAGNSVAAENMLYLMKFAASAEAIKYEERTQQTLRSLVPYLRRAPNAAPRAAVVMAEVVDRQAVAENNH